MLIFFITIVIISSIVSILNCLFRNQFIDFTNSFLFILFNITFLIWIIKYFGRTYIFEMRKLIKKLLRLFKR